MIPGLNSRMESIRTIVCPFILLILITSMIPASLNAQSAPFELQDSADRTVSFSKIPERIVVIGRGQHMVLHLIYMFPQIRDRIVGFEDRSSRTNEFLSLIDSGWNSKSKLGIQPGPEEIAALKPDLVIMKGSHTDALGTALISFGIPVFHLGMETPDQFFKDVDNLGRILKSTARSETISAFYQTRLDRFKTACEAIDSAGRPNVLVVSYEQRANKAAVRVPARSWMQTIQTITAGGRPVWLDSTQTTDGWSIVNFEQIAAWDPDIIFVITWYTEDQPVVMKSLENDPHWKRLRAVKNGMLYVWMGFTGPPLDTRHELDGTEAAPQPVSGSDHQIRNYRVLHTPLRDGSSNC